jgi:hypothetical protein
VKVWRATARGRGGARPVFAELERMQGEWRVVTPRIGFYDEVAANRAAIGNATSSGRAWGSRPG